MVQAWQVSYNGITVGADTSYPLMYASGFDTADVRVDEQIRMADHGAFLYSWWLGTRTVTLEGETTGTSSSDLQAKMDILRSMFVPQGQELPLRFKWGNVTDRRIECRPVRFTFAIDDMYNIGTARWIGQFKAEDPRIYDDALTTVTFPLGGDGTETKSVSNTGTFYVPWTAVFSGPGNDFNIVDLVQNKNVKVNYALSAGQTITINSRKKTIKRDNGVNLYQYLANTSEWFEISPLTNNIRCEISAGWSGNSECSLEFRSGWN